MTALQIVRPHVVIFSDQQSLFDYWVEDVLTRIDRLESSSFLHAVRPAVGLWSLKTDPHVRIVVVDQCPDTSQEHYPKLFLIRDIKRTLVRKCPIITVGPNEPHSFLAAGATHEVSRAGLPIALTGLLLEELDSWALPKTEPAKARPKPKKRRGGRPPRTPRA